MSNINTDELLKPIYKALKQKDYALAQQLSSNVVKRYPLYEEAWILLGDSLAFQGQGLMAQRVYTRGALFNPDGKWLNDKLEKLRTVPNGQVQQEIENLLQVPHSATVGAAVIVKNEERCIGKCIEALLDAVDQILVIDTGCTDQTIQIASTYPKTSIVKFPWNADFSAARNFGMEQLNTEWIFWVDADEYLYPEDIQKVKYAASLLESYQPHPLLYVGQVNQIGDSISVHYTPRLFPLKGQLKYHGRIHEQLGAIHGNRYTDSNTHDFLVQIRLLHDGYDPKKIDIAKKLQRNISLLKQMTAEEPNDPTWWMFLGRELLGIGQIDQGIEALFKAEEKGKMTKGFGSLLEVQRLLVIGLTNKKHLIEAEKVCYRMMETNSKFPDSYYYLAFILLQKGSQFYEEAEQNLRKAKMLFSEYRGLVEANQEILDWKADLRLADLFRLAGKASEAKNLYTRVLKICPMVYKESIENLLRSL